MNQIYIATPENGRMRFFKGSILLLIFSFLISFGLKAQIYQENFGTSLISVHPYTPVAGTYTSNANLGSFLWANSTGAWISFTGSAGQAISLNNSGGTPTITFSFAVAPGYEASISSFSFWRQRSTTGAQNWSMTINGSAVGAGTVATSGAGTGNIAVSTANNLTGTVTIVLSLSGATGTGTFRLDDFTLNGTVVPAATLSATAVTDFGNVCTSTVPGVNTFDITGTSLTVANVTVGPLAGFAFSSDNLTFNNSLSLTQSGGAYAQTIYVRFSPIAVQAYDGNIPVGGGGAGGITVPVTGSGVNTSPSVNSGTVTATTTNSATINASITSTGCTAITGYGIEYSTVPGFANGTGTPVAGGALTAGNYSTGLLALAPPGQIFYFHTYATNAGGTTYGNENTFTLASVTPTLSVPPAGAGSLAAFGSTCVNTSVINSFNLSGSVLNGSNIVIGPLSNYTFSTSIAGIYSNTITLVNGGSGYSYTGGVLSGCTIYVKFIPTLVQSYNGNITISGGGATSISVPVTGSGINTASTVVTNAALYITTSTATLPGTISSAGCGITLGYGIEYSTAPFAPGAGTVVPAGNLSGGNFSINLSALAASTPYYYYAYSVNAAGTSYGAISNFSTFGLPTKLVIIAVNPASPTALTPFSVTVQAQDNLNNPVDVISNTDISFAQAAGTGIFSFPNAPLAAGTIPANANTITITDLAYDIVENNVGINATAVTGMTGLSTSINRIFNVIAYVGPTTFIWKTPSASAWLTGSNWNTGTSPGTSTPGLNQHLASFTNLANADLNAVGSVGINMNSVGGAYDLGAIYFAETYGFNHTNNLVAIGNSSTTISGTLSLWGAALANAGGISGNNYANLLIANYMNTANTTVLEVKNAIGSGNKNLTLRIAAAGSIVAGPGRTININTLLTGTPNLTFTGGGNFSLAPSGAAAVNTFSGAITVANGILVTGNAGAFSTASPNVVTLGSSAANAGVLRLNGQSVTIGGLNSAGTAGNANIVDNGNAAATLTINNSAAYIFRGALKNGSTGILSLVKNGVGNLNFQGLNTLTGTITVNNGALILARAGGSTLPVSSVVQVNGAGILQVSTDQVIKDISLATGGTLRVDAGVTLTITGNYNAAVCSIINNGTIVLQGTVLQSFPGTVASVNSMNNLTVNNAFGVNLNNSLNIAGTLQLSAGAFTVGPYTLTINNPITGTLTNFSANNTSSIVVAGTAAAVNIPAVVTQLRSLSITNTTGSVLQGNLNVSTSLLITAGTLSDDTFVLNGPANVTMTGGTLNLEQNTALLPGLTGVYVLSGGTVLFNGVGVGTDAQIVRPVNYFNLSSASTGDRVLSATGIIGVGNTFVPNLPNNLYTVTNSTVDYNKASAQNIAGFGYYNITVSGAGGVAKTLAGNIDVQGTLTISSNTILGLANFNTTLKSNATNSANVAVINTPNSITYGTGKFIVERFIPTGISHGKSWQLLSVPVSGTQSVKATWQENNMPLVAGAAGFGTTISSERAGAVARGYDFYTPVAPSIKTYNAVTGAWVGIDDGVTNTASLAIANKKGYMLFVRGDRSVQTSAGAANITTLRTSGRLFAPGTDAPPSSAVAAGKFETIGNPYASAIDYINVQSVSPGIDSKYYVWDPLLPGTNGLGFGGYQLLSSSNLWKPIPGGTLNYPTGIAYTKIQSGQAFFVFSTGGGTVNFAENQKVSGSSLLFRQVQQQHNAGFLRAWLKGASNATMADGNVVTFSNDYQNSFDADDALKLNNGTESFGINSNSRTLALEARSPVLVRDTVFYNIDNLSVKEYQIVFEPENMNTNGLSAYLVDRYLATSTNIDLTTGTIVNFIISNDPLSKQKERFYIVFKQVSAPVPVTFVQVAAKRNDAETIEVNWSVENEVNLEAYQVEKGGDGRNFTSVYEHRSVSNNGQHAAYNFTDTQSSTTGVFYRIKAINSNGQVQYSNIVEVEESKSNDGISIFPNPVEDKTVHVKMVGQAPGRYEFQLVNSIGQVIYKGATVLQNENFSFYIKLGSQVKKGIYKLNINGGDMKTSRQVFVQ